MTKQLEDRQVEPPQARYVGLHDVIRIGEGVTLLKGQVCNAQAASLLGKLEVEESDLLPGQYEGGFKVWEGSVDLAEYVAELWQHGSAPVASSLGSQPSDATAAAAPSADPAASAAAGGGSPAGAASGAAAAAVAGAGRGGLAGRLAGQRVLELGCGHALPGLVALLAGAEVHFQVVVPLRTPPCRFATPPLNCCRTVPRWAEMR
jgi:hypothetical protein